jgi:hypothetical protein
MGCKGSKQDRAVTKSALKADAWRARANAAGVDVIHSKDTSTALTSEKTEGSSESSTNTNESSQGEAGQTEHSELNPRKNQSKPSEILGDRDLDVCRVPGCSKRVAVDHPGSPYCVEHEFEPVGQTSLEETQAILGDFRDALGFEGWKHCFFDCKRGWSGLGRYKTMEELGTSVNGLEVNDGKLVWIDMRCCNLTGTIPPSIARLDNLAELWLGGNKLSGHLPANIGTPSCLPKLTRISVLDAISTDHDQLDVIVQEPDQEGRKLARAGSFVC